jgi:hypothetical protein
MLKKILLPIGLLALSAFVQVADAQITVEPLVLHSRSDAAGALMPYFSATVTATTSAASSVGGNATANGGPGGSLYTSGNFNVVGTRSGAWLLDSTSLGTTLDGLYGLDITWANQSSLKLVRIDVTDATGTTTFNNVDQNTGINTWLNLGSFTFDGSAGQEVRIWNNEGASSGNVNFDSIRLTPVPVPEPSTIALGLLGGASLLVLRRRQSK